MSVILADAELNNQFDSGDSEAYYESDKINIKDFKKLVAEYLSYSPDDAITTEQDALNRFKTIVLFNTYNPLYTSVLDNGWVISKAIEIALKSYVKSDFFKCESVEYNILNSTLMLKVSGLQRTAIQAMRSINNIAFSTEKYEDLGFTMDYIDDQGQKNCYVYSFIVNFKYKDVLRHAFVIFKIPTEYWKHMRNSYDPLQFYYIPTFTYINEELYNNFKSMLDNAVKEKPELACMVPDCTLYDESLF